MKSKDTMKYYFIPTDVRNSKYLAIPSVGEDVE